MYVFVTGKVQEYASKCHEGTKEQFDYKQYADDYPDLKDVFGYDKEKLYSHYVNNGKKENRIAIFYR